MKPEPYQASSPDSRACFVLRPLVLLLAALAAVLLPAALGALALGAQNRAGAFNPPGVTFAGGRSVENPCSRQDSKAPGGGVAVGCFVGDEDAAAADLAEDAADEAPAVLRHYTTFDHAADIEADDLIKPSGDGYTYLTPDSYDDGLTAQQRLALKGTPDGYFEIPFDNPPASSTVSPANGQPGGGQESPVAGGVPFRPADRSSPLVR